MENVVGNCKKNGYFIGCCYDGNKIFDRFYQKEPFRYVDKNGALVYEIEKKYVGIDYIKDFINIANAKYKDKSNVNFICLEGTDLSNIQVKNHSPYSVFLILGLYPYIDDEESYEIIKKLLELSANKSQIIIREPIGIKTEIILDNVWSEDMETHYTAKYRTYDWFKKMFSDVLYPKGFTLSVDQALYPDHLNNRIETKQHLFCLKK